MHFKEDLVKKIESLDVVQIKKEGSEFNFLEIGARIESLVPKIKQVVKSDDFWERIPRNQHTQNVQSLTALVNVLVSMANFKAVELGQPGDQRQSLINQFHDHVKELHTHFFLPFELYLFEKQTSSIDLTTLKKELEQEIQSVKSKSKQVDELLDQTKKSAATSGVVKFATIFKAQADKHLGVSFVWLVVVAAAGVAMGWFLYHIINSLTEAITSKEVSVQISLQLFFSKVLIVSFFSYLFYQVVKNYNAHMHLSALNKHRENCLKTFEIFVESTHAATTRDAVLIQATKAIFEAGDTGFISQKDSTMSGFETIKIVEGKQ